MQRRLLLTAIGLAGLAANPACAAEPRKIGLALPMSGPFADYGKQIERGVRLYLAANGDTVAGRKIELIIKDDSPGTAGDVSKRLAQELVVKDKVDVLAGFGLTPAALAVAPLATEAKKPMVVMNAATSVITTRSSYIVRSSHTLAHCSALSRSFFSGFHRKGFMSESHDAVCRLSSHRYELPSPPLGRGAFRQPTLPLRQPMHAASRSRCFPLARRPVKLPASIQEPMRCRAATCPTPSTSASRT